MIIDERGRKVLQGQEALDGFAKGVSRLLEGRKLHYHTSFQAIPISIENRRGSVRSGKDPDGGEWRTKMKQPYGYIPGTRGADGDELDVFVGPVEHAAFAYVVHSNNPESGDFDEDKVMLGFKNQEAAKNCFLNHYDDPKFFGGIDKIPMWQFREKAFIKKHTTRKLVASMRESMKHAMLGHHQDIMVDPEVREGGHGSGRKKEDPQMYYNAGKALRDNLALSQGMQKSGQNMMKSGQIFRKREGGPGSGPRAAIEKAGGKYAGSSEGHPTKGRLHWFHDPDSKHGSTLAMYEKDIHGPESVKDHMGKKRREFGESREHGVQGMHWGISDRDIMHMPRSEWEKAKKKMLIHDAGQSLQKEFDRLEHKSPAPKDREAQEHGVKGMKWGVRHARHDAKGQRMKDQPSATGKPRTGKKPVPIAQRSLSNDPRTLNMMQHVNVAENKLNSQPKQPGARPQDQHAQAKDMLKQLGWKIAGAAAGVMGLGGVFDGIRSVVQAPTGQKMFLKTDRNGGHSLSTDKAGKMRPQTKRARTSVRESRPFGERLGSFLREAKRHRVYYARSLQRYGTGAEAGEKDDLREEHYPDSDIKFPRTRRHAELGMDYFHKKIDKCDEVVITPLRRNRITAGVFSEAQHALHKGIPVRVLRHGKLMRVKRLDMIKGGRPGGEYAKYVLHKKRSVRKHRK